MPSIVPTNHCAIVGCSRGKAHNGRRRAALSTLTAAAVAPSSSSSSAMRPPPPRSITAQMTLRHPLERIRQLPRLLPVGPPSLHPILILDGALMAVPCAGRRCR